MKKNLVLYTLLLSTVSFGLHSEVLENFKKHTYYLASDALEGRGSGSKGLELAAKYIAQQYKAIGLQGLSGQSYLQPFSVPARTAIDSNVVGIIRAATKTNRSIVFTAHYDGLGQLEKTDENSSQEDLILNGARDNAIGVAAMIELARQYRNEGKPAYNLVFVATAAEETGQYGSHYYVEHPVFAREEIIINVNFDGFNVSGPREDYIVLPRQGVDFVDEIDLVASKLGWVNKTPDWVDQMNNKFDTSTFLRLGIPAFTLWTGDQEKGGKQAKRLKFGSIHSPNDEVTPNWRWDGVEEHILLYKAITDYFLKQPTGISVTDRKLFI